MANVEDFETPEALLKASVEAIRNANGYKVLVLPVEASREQQTLLGQELVTRHPWHRVHCIAWADHPGQKTEATHTLEELCGMIKPPVFTAD